jgi:hemerythrin-like domain-containing protein
MLIRIGKPAPAADAVSLLLECHERIRAFLALARRVAEARSTEAHSLTEAASQVVRYFTEALPLHARDEEESVLPRLRGKEAALDSELEAMAREHVEHGRPLRTLVLACAELAREPERHARLASVILEATGELDRHFARHLEREEEVIFSAMRRLLGPDSDAEVVNEMRARRRVDGELGPRVRLPSDPHESSATPLLGTTRPERS